jgi:hypothetical protein
MHEYEIKIEGTHHLSEQESTLAIEKVKAAVAEIGFLCDSIYLEQSDVSAIPSGYRLITDEEKEMHEIPETACSVGMMLFSEVDHRWHYFPEYATQKKFFLKTRYAIPAKYNIF